MDETALVINAIKVNINSYSASDFIKIIKECETDNSDTEIAQVYEELKIKNIIERKVETEIVNYLIKRRFVTPRDAQVTDVIEISDEELEKRIEFTRKCFGDIMEEYSTSKDSCGNDDAFILISKCIAKNLRLLRRQKKIEASFLRLPWEEMEFCLSIFIQSSLKQSKTICNVLIDKDKILEYLQQFLNEYTEKKNSK